MPLAGAPVAWCGRVLWCGSGRWCAWAGLGVPVSGSMVPSYRLCRTGWHFLAGIVRPIWGTCGPGPIVRGLCGTSPRRPRFLDGVRVPMAP